MRARRSAQAVAFLRRRQQILADFDQHAGQAAPRRKLIHAVPDKRAVIGLVVADHEIFRAQRLDQGRGEAVVSSHSTPTCQGRATPWQCKA